MSKEKRLDKLGDRMKSYERIETSQTFRPNSILYVRLDGRGFSKFTKGLLRPYDKNMSTLMIETAKSLVKNFNCVISYIQSDEISLIIRNDYGSLAIFDGKKQKMISTMAAHASAFFTSNLPEYLPSKVGEVPTFDCRIFEVPNVVEAVNALYWREKKKKKNSVSMASHDNFSHKELHKKNVKDMKDMLLNCKGIQWDEYPSFFKYGTYCRRELYEKIGSDNVPVIRSRIGIIDGNLSSYESIEDKIKFVFEDKS